MPDYFRDFLKKLYLKSRKLLLSPFLLLRRTYIPKDEEIKKILFLRHDRLGDMVLSTPVFKALKRRFPDATLAALVSEKNREVVLNNPHVDEIMVYRGLRPFLSEMRNRAFDMAIDPFITYKMKYGALLYLAGAKYRLGFEESGREIFFNIKGLPISYGKTMTDMLLDMVEVIGAKRNDCKPEIFLTTEEDDVASRFLAAKGLNIDKPSIAIHPGARYKSKIWPPERFGLVANEIISKYGANIIVFSGENEKYLLDGIRQTCKKGLLVISDVTLRQFMAILNKCNLFLGNNSGPLHVAAALGLRTVSTLGSPIAGLWTPFGHGHIVLNKNLPCAPCNREDCENPRCLELITVEEFMEAVEKQFDFILGKAA